MLVAQMMRYGTDATQKGYDGQYLWKGHPMMLGGSNAFFWIHAVLAFVTWVLVVAVLVALVRWLWKKGDKVK